MESDKRLLLRALRLEMARRNAESAGLFVDAAEAAGLTDRALEELVERGVESIDEVVNDPRA